MNEQDFAARVRARLDESTEELPPEVLARLQSARMEALAQLRGQRQTPARMGNPFALNWKFSVPAFALVVLAAGYVVLKVFGDSPEQAIHELEAEMLGHELPPHAFIDEGFEQWLKRNPKP